MAQKSASTDQPSWLTGRWALAGALAVLAIVFIVENTDPVAIRVIIPVVVTPLWAALVAMVLIGLVIGLLLGRRTRR